MSPELIVAKYIPVGKLRMSNSERFTEFTCELITVSPSILRIVIHEISEVPTLTFKSFVGAF